MLAAMESFYQIVSFSHLILEIKTRERVGETLDISE